MENNGNEINFGGFVALSTVDWPGLSASVVFLRGCPNICKDCHNQHLTVETEPVPITMVIDEIKTASPFISALIISGGEPTKHKDALKRILKSAKKMGLKTRVQTSGIYPDTITEIITDGLVDSIALDIKADIEHLYEYISPKVPVASVLRSLKICEEAIEEGTLRDFELVHTIFPYGDYKTQLRNISEYASVKTRFVLQEGVPKNREITPITRDELKTLAEKYIIQSDIRLRSRTNGEERVK